ncbi:PrkA AAA domain protein [Marinomonas gallaica]|uniref:PrkA AAA domain protein n=1 Tax=Marinomonas gallaica TaxID=1806667 RepID=A0A1C3JQG1_9GAMM|nr:PrkA AAA domain protein [Marinomonas gallaica]SBT19594.1 PrkA AAA domain protein [Marinomonas gallaica]
MSIFDHVQSRFDAQKEEELSLDEYLTLCKDNPAAYASAPERLLMAIGEPEVIDTSKDSRSSRIFSNKLIKRYPTFEHFHGMEDSIEKNSRFFNACSAGARRI